ncbi:MULTISPECIES: hypothetical protein [Pseudomonas syringae group]|uniref:hypothetical protein n=1 Tax=Pseudomonas syringae group TaxID=136849 RepID=UPI000A551764|nr:MULTISPECIES: hypothetical protein [Pseudomonas syringae group]
MDADVAVGRPLGILEAPNGFLVHVEGGLISNAVLASAPQNKTVGNIMDTIVNLYTTSTTMMEHNENYGWGKKRSTPGQGPFSRLNLTTHMTGPSLIRNFLPATAAGKKHTHCLTISSSIVRHHWQVTRDRSNDLYQLFSFAASRAGSMVRDAGQMFALVKEGRYFDRFQATSLPARRGLLTK